MRKLPVGIQTFSTIREENFFYIDKTAMALDLVEKGAYYFLARPRRFGKSLFISTLQALFEGQKKLFRGLAAYERWDWQVKYPVIKLSFAGVSQTVPDVEKAILEMLQSNQERLHVSCGDTTDIGAVLTELIKKCHNKFSQRVVVLIDEYDKCILDNIDQSERVQEAREALDKIYSSINDNDEHLKFVFIAGITRSADLSLFSGLNNLEDITFSEEFAGICGYTQYDLDTIFFSLLQNVDKEKLKEWYGGYNYPGESVYNPFDILLFLKNHCKFDNYWFKSNPPVLPAKLALQQDYFIPQLEGLTVSSSVLDNFDIENPALESVLYQTGYLTIKNTGNAGAVTLYTLSYPNLETRCSLNDYFLDALTGATSGKGKFQVNIFSAFENNNMPLLKNTLSTFFSSVSSPYKDGDHGYMGSILYTCLASLGFEMIIKAGSNKKKLSLTLLSRKNIYFLDFSVDGSEVTPQQVKSDSLQRLLGEGKNAYMLSIVLNSKDKKLTHFECKQVS